MILWDFAIEEHIVGIQSMNSQQQYRFAACCICESLLHLIDNQKDSIIELIKNDLQNSVVLAVTIANDRNVSIGKIKTEKKLLENLSDFINTVDNATTQVPGLYDISVALLMFVDAIENRSIEENVIEIASYTYQSILNEQLMFNLSEGGILESELVLLEEKNLICTQIIASQIDWYTRIKNDELTFPIFELLRLLK